MTASVATVGELASSFEMKLRCLFPPATVRPLIFPSLFFLRNIWDSNTSDFSFSVRSEQCLGSNLSLECNFFISACMALFALSPHCFKPDLRDSCVGKWRLVSWKVCCCGVCLPHELGNIPRTGDTDACHNPAVGW